MLDLNHGFLPYQTEVSSGAWLSAPLPFCQDEGRWPTGERRFSSWHDMTIVPGMTCICLAAQSRARPTIYIGTFSARIPKFGSLSTS